MDAIRLELSREPVALVKSEEGTPELLDSIGAMRSSLGFEVLKVHVVDNLALRENSFEIYISWAKVASTVADAPGLTQRGRGRAAQGH